MDTQFTWIPFFQEFAKKLLPYRNNIQPLLDFIYTLKDNKGNITAYVGLCRDFSELRHLEQQIAVEDAKVQEQRIDSVTRRWHLLVGRDLPAGGTD